jgi:hypothetical protein
MNSGFLFFWKSLNFSLSFEECLSKNEELLLVHCIHMGVSMCVHVGVSFCVHMGVSVCVHVGVSMCVHVGVSVCVCVHVGGCLCVHVGVGVSVCVHMGVSMCVHVHVHAHIHCLMHAFTVAGVDFGEFPLLLSIVVFDTWSLSLNLEVAKPQDPPVCTHQCWG